MFKKGIERAVKANLRGDNLQNALDFTALEAAATAAGGRARRCLAKRLIGSASRP